MAEAPHQSGKVRFLSRPMRFLLMVVEQGTASRWCELLGRVGTHWLFLLAFCSLGDTDTRPLSLWAKSRPPAARLWPVDARQAPAAPRPPWGPLCAQLRGGYSPGSKRHLLGVTSFRGGGEGRGPSPVCELSPVLCAGLGTQERVRVHGGWRADFQESPEGSREEAQVNGWAGGQGWRHREGPDSGGGALSGWLGVPGGLHTFDQAVISDAWSSLRQVMPLASGPSGMERYSRKRDSK